MDSTCSPAAATSLSLSEYLGDIIINLTYLAMKFQNMLLQNFVSTDLVIT